MFRYRREIESLLMLKKPQLMQLMLTGYKVNLENICGFEYKGVSLGLPKWIERLTWKKFKKAFHKDLTTGQYRGWNIKIHQNPIFSDYFSKTRSNRDHCFGPFRLQKVDQQLNDFNQLKPFENKVLLDYSCGGKIKLMSMIRDPLVSLLADDDHNLLLGYSALRLCGKYFSTNSFFVLEKDSPIKYIWQ